MNHSPGPLYIASSLHNVAAVRRLRDRFWREHRLRLSYDWTELGQCTDPEQMATLARLEAEGVCRARCLLWLFPARLGSHFEAGIAYGRQIPIVLCCPDPEQLQTSFHHLPELLQCSSEDGAVRAVLQALERGVQSGQGIAGQPIEYLDYNQPQPPCSLPEGGPA